MLKAFAITANLKPTRLRAMPLEQRHHWLSIRYHFGDREQTPVPGIPYRLISQANPDIVLEGITDHQGRIFEDRAIAGHYDLLLMPQPDPNAWNDRKEALKSLDQNLASIRVHLQHQQPAQTEPAQIQAERIQVEQTQATQFWDQYFKPVMPALSVQPWIDYLLQGSNHQEITPEQRWALQESLLLLAQDSAHKTGLQRFISELPAANPHAILTAALRKALGLSTPKQEYPGLSELTCAVADNLQQVAAVLKASAPRRYARVSVNQPHQMKVPPQGAGALAINHYAEGEQPNLLSLAHQLPFSNLEDCINPVTGATHWQKEDFVIPGRLPLPWVRGWACDSSDAPQDSALGAGWYHPFSAGLDIRNNHAHFFHQGVQCTLPVPDIGTFASNSQHQVILYRESGTRWLVKFRSKPLMTFSGRHSCRLERITQSQGHFWQCEYGPDGQHLLALRNERGLMLHLQYQGSRLQEILLNRQQHQPLCLVRYHYDEHHQLIGSENYQGALEQYSYQNNCLALVRSHTGNEVQIQADQVSANGSHWQLQSYRDKENTTVIALQDQQQRQQRIKLSPQLCEAEHTNACGGTSHYYFEPDARLLRICNPAGNEFQYYFDGFGNLTAYLDPAGGGFNLIYNEQLLPISFCDALGNSWECDYFSCGRVREVRFPSGLSYRYEYRDSPLPVAVQINSELRRELTWSDAGELLQDSEPPADTGQGDSQPGRKSADGQNATAMPNPQFDACGMLIACNEGENSMMRFHRDPVGRLLQLKFPDGKRINCSYNQNGQLTEVMAPDNCLQFDYDKDGKGIDHPQDTDSLLAALDPALGQSYGRCIPTRSQGQVMVIQTPYRYWELNHWEDLFTAFSHEGHQDALFTLRLWQELQNRSWLPFNKGL